MPPMALLLVALLRLAAYDYELWLALDWRLLRALPPAIDVEPARRAEMATSLGIVAERCQQMRCELQPGRAPRCSPATRHERWRYVLRRWREGQ